MPKEELIEIITREVLRILNTKHEDSGCPANKPRALILGSAEKIPPETLNGFNIYNIDDFVVAGGIDKFCCVIITEMSLTQLSDIALGRDDRPYQRAVIEAILSGTKVYLLSEALTYQRYAKTSDKAFYDLLINYEKKLIDYGISIIPAEKLIDPVIELNPNNEVDCADKVVTGKKAEELCRKLKGTLNLKNGTIITPLAKDAFGAAKIKINFI